MTTYSSDFIKDYRGFIHQATDINNLDDFLIKVILYLLILDLTVPHLVYM